MAYEQRAYGQRTSEWRLRASKPQLGALQRRRRAQIGKTVRTGADALRQRFSDVCVRRWLVAGAILIAVLAGSLMFGVLPAESAQQEQTVTYVVQPGDTLWKYARQITPADGDVRDSVAEIMRLNQMSAPQVIAGQKLKVPKN